MTTQNSNQYIVTVATHDVVRSRLAVASLTEAEDLIRREAFNLGGISVEDAYHAAGVATREGESEIAGTVFTVSVVTDDQLRAAVAVRIDGAYSRPLAEIITSYNGKALNRTDHRSR